MASVSARLPRSVLCVVELVGDTLGDVALAALARLQEEGICTFGISAPDLMHTASTAVPIVASAHDLAADLRELATTAVWVESVWDPFEDGSTEQIVISCDVRPDIGGRWVPCATWTYP